VYALRGRGLVTTAKRKGGDWVASVTAEGATAATTGWMPVHLPVPHGRARRAVPPDAAPPASVGFPEGGEGARTAPRAAGRSEVDHPRGRKAAPPRTPDSARVAVQATRSSLTGRADARGLLQSSGEGSVPVTVSRGSIPRAMALLQTLFAAVRDAGGEVAVARSPRYTGAHGGPARTVLVFDGHEYAFSVVEDTDRTPHEPTAAERAALARHSWTSIPEWDYRPSGRLTINLDPTYERSRTARGRFADGKKARVEDKVPAVVAEPLERSQAATSEQREEQRLDALYATERASAVEQARYAYLEDLRASAADKQAERWEHAQRLRAYSTAMAHRSGAADANEWRTWITAHADRLDPPGQVPLPPRLPSDLSEANLSEYLRGWPSHRPYGWNPRG